MNYFSVIVWVAFALHTNFALTLTNPIDTTDDNFNVFLINALEKYPEWLRNNSLDPSPPMQSLSNVRINKEGFQLNCTLTNEQIIGHANQSNLFEITEVNTMVPIKRIILGFDTKGVISYHGNYNASGTIDTNVSLKGNGSWIYTTKFGIHENVIIIYDTNADGYITIWDDRYLHNVYPLDESDDEIYFEDLWDDVAAGNAEVIRNNLREAYLNRLADSEIVIPNRSLMFQYLKEIFKVGILGILFLRTHKRLT